MTTITVAAGDTLSSLAKKHGVTVSALTAANGLSSSSLIKVGQKLTLPGAAGSPPAAPPAPTPAPSGPAGEGAFAEIPVDDRSEKFAGLSLGPLPKNEVNSIILHRTGGSAASALRAYAERLKTGSSIAAHYLIDEKGATILTVAIDRKVSHVGRTREGFGDSGNANAVGIEVAGTPLALEAPAGAKDTATLEKNRASIVRMDIAPLFRRRLLDLSDRDFYQMARDNRDDKGKWYLYGDLDVPQRRPCVVLAAALLKYFGLKEKDLLAHETVSFKSPGEGENIKEFLTARFAYPGLVAKLGSLAQGDAALRANASLQAIAGEEKVLADALTRDATAAENAALAAGAATAREAARSAFYAKFWKRSAQLADLVAFLSGGGGQPAELAKKLASWVR